uniref:Uncharacterized protein n=1 Tax=Melopsittacus undulatus TaxID=13146 RepID=A0A8V5FPP5_MELUD
QLSLPSGRLKPFPLVPSYYENGADTQKSTGKWCVEHPSRALRADTPYCPLGLLPPPSHPPCTGTSGRALPEPDPQPDLEQNPEPDPQPDLEQNPEPDPQPDLEQNPDPNPQPDLEQNPEPRPAAQPLSCQEGDGTPLAPPGFRTLRSRCPAAASGCPVPGQGRRSRRARVCVTPHITGITGGC